jgi:chromosome segregation ATPase
VRNIVEGGSAWRDGTIKLSDICVAVDGVSMEDRSLQDLRNVVIGAEGTTVALTFHRIIDQSRTVFQVILRRGVGLVEENVRLTSKLSSALQIISSLEQDGHDAHAGDLQTQMLQQQLEAQVQELLYCRQKLISDEAHIARASQTIQSLEEKVLLSSTECRKLLEKHEALESRFERDIESVEKAAALQLERCSREADATILHLQAQLQDQRKQEEELRQEVAELKIQSEELSSKLVQMGRQDVEAQFLRQQLEAQVQELLSGKLGDEAHIARASQTVQSLEEKVLLSSTECRKLLEKHEALESRFERDIESVEKAAALQLERCSREADATILHLQAQLQDQRKQEEELRQEVAELKIQSEELSSKLVQMGRQDVEAQFLRQQLEAQVQELLSGKLGDEAHIARASQTVQSLEEKVLLSSTECRKLLEKHEALESRFELDIESVEKAAALQLERCSREADATILHLQTQLQDQRKQEEELRQEVAELKIQSEELSSKLVQMGRQDVEAQFLRQQLEAQVQELLSGKLGDEAHIARASQTVQSLEEKVLLSSTECRKLLEKHEALESRFELDIESVEKAAALQLERCSREADATILHLQTQLQDQRKQEEELRQEVAELKIQSEELSSKLVQMGRQDVEAQFLRQQLEAQVQELLSGKLGDEAHIARASQTIQSLEEKVLLSSTECRKLLEKHEALESRFELDIESVEKAAALQLERCSREADATILHLQTQLQDQRKQEEELRQEVAELKIQSEELSSKLVQMGRQDVEAQFLRQQLEAQVQELLSGKLGDEAHIARASQTVQSLEEKVLLSSTECRKLLEKHEALESRFELDIESVEKAAALQLERCSREADATILHLQTQLQDQRKQEEELRQEVAELKIQSEELSSKLVQMGRQVRQYEAQIARHSSEIESELQRSVQLLSHSHVLEKSLGEARASLGSLNMENARLESGLRLSNEAVEASHSRERELILRLETMYTNGVAETASRALVVSEQHRILQNQVEVLQKECSEVQGQLREARRSADATLAAEHDALSRLSNANVEIAQLRRHVADLTDAARETGDRMRAIQNEADSNKLQLYDLVRLCRQQERAHASLKEVLQVHSMQFI